MALTSQFLAGQVITGQKINESSIPVVTSTSDITAPFVGQLVFSTTDNLVYRYDGSWHSVLATGGNTAATQHEARYQHLSVVSIPNATDTAVPYDTAVTTCNDVTPSGTGNINWTLNRGGLWLITAGVVYSTGADAGERLIFATTGTNLATFANRFDVMSIGRPGVVNTALKISTAIRAAAGTIITIGTFQSNGGALNTVASVIYPAAITLTWLREL